MTKLTFTEQLRKIIDECGESRSQICKATGLDEGNMSRFMRLGVGLNTSSIDLLCDHLGLRLTAISKAKKRGGNSARKRGE